MSFLSGIFLTALVAAGGPLIIHLLNRRRRRTIHWGPMDFLMEVIKRSRRILHLRDVFLLVLRTVVVALFVLAMSRPYWSAGADAGGSTQPMHAVIVIDNSLSMGYAEFNKTLLDKAKVKALEFVKALPSGSEMSIIPLCSNATWHTDDVYANKEDAMEAINRIEVVDRSVQLSDGMAEAQRACRFARDIPSKRVVFIGDVQSRSWSMDGVGAYLKDISDIQIVKVAADKQANNMWVSDFKLLHSVADTVSPAVFRATIRNEGKERRGVTVTLTVSGPDDKTDEYPKHVDLLPGSELQLDFRHKFTDESASSSEPAYYPATVRMTPTDDLEMDNFRTIIVPVVANTPILFIDQHGSRENAAANLYGETGRVRKLLSSRVVRDADDSTGKPIAKNLMRIDEITRKVLKETRLVVIAGVKAPDAEQVVLLREFVEQGGNIFLGAGGEFDPVQWTEAAWLDGAGILPAPLTETIGRLPKSNQVRLESFGLNAASVVGGPLYLDTSPEETEAILNTPRFFKAVAADVVAARKAISEIESKRIKTRKDWLDEYNANERKWNKAEADGTLTPADSKKRQADRLKANAMDPRWLAWRNPLARDDSQFKVDELVKLTQPHVLGSYDNGRPFVIERRIGKGRVVMLTSGMWPEWNTMALGNGVLLLDRIMRSLLVRSLPDRTFGAQREILIPVTAADQVANFTVQAPGETTPRIRGVEAFGAESYGLPLRSIQKRGVYTIRRQGASAKKDGDEEAPDGWSMALAVNGPADESDLVCSEQDDLPKKIGDTTITWISSNEKISLAGKSYIGHDFWWVLMLLTLGCVLLEMVLLTGWRLAGLPSKSTGAASDQTATSEITQ
ncbi:MAG: BatA domain-containing protein [Phycisphaerae bacterium]|jgi:hypothetical protein|nr:BatA domain-containing protein [Phycisphaerae bacterium]